MSGKNVRWDFNHQNSRRKRTDVNLFLSLLSSSAFMSNSPCRFSEAEVQLTEF